jgi:hypothetical protein
VTKLQYGILSSAVTLFTVAAWRWRRQAAGNATEGADRGDVIFTNRPLPSNMGETHVPSVQSIGD